MLWLFAVACVGYLLRVVCVLLVVIEENYVTFKKTPRKQYVVDVISKLVWESP